MYCTSVCLAFSPYTFEANGSVSELSGSAAASALIAWRRLHLELLHIAVQRAVCITSSAHCPAKSLDIISAGLKLTDLSNII